MAQAGDLGLPMMWHGNGKFNVSTALQDKWDQDIRQLCQIPERLADQTPDNRILGSAGLLARRL